MAAAEKNFSGFSTDGASDHNLNSNCASQQAFINNQNISK